MNKLCDNVEVVIILSLGMNKIFRRDNQFEYEDIFWCFRQTRKFYAQAKILLRNFRYCTKNVKCMLFKSFSANTYCCPLHFI